MLLSMKTSSKTVRGSIKRELGTEMAKCSDSGIDDEDATKFIYNNGNNASTDNITA